jgi:hypothetical protein
MEKIFVKGLGLIENNEENKPLLIKKGLIEDDTIKTRAIKPNSVNVKRVKPKRTTK